MKLKVAFLIVLFAASSYALADPIVIDFESDDDGALANGDTGLNFGSLGLSITSSSEGSYPAMIFDTSPSVGSVTGGDTDLVTPGYHPSNTTDLGLVLVVSDGNHGSNPGDKGSGGTLVFVFDSEVKIVNLDFLDIDCGETATVRFYDGSSALLRTEVINGIGDNSFISPADFDEDGVRRMEVQLSKSGAIAELAFSVPEPASLLLLGLGLSTLAFASRRF